MQLRANSPLEIMANTRDQSIEAIKHQSKPIYGIMWHPERETPYSEHDLNFFTNIFSND
jgi:putative glutamine amidotransferase